MITQTISLDFRAFKFKIKFTLENEQKKKKLKAKGVEKHCQNTPFYNNICE